QMRSFGAGQIFGVGGAEPQQTGEFGSLLNNLDFDLLEIVVAAPTADAVTALPATLSATAAAPTSQAIPASNGPSPTKPLVKMP
ncbi:hypothetical protein ACQCP8_25735, partial [Ralstonia pseudosolanacearum]|uniref:hypothetical protein n=1 Tax=Ralstonia pseudosolanacearum TaxID=1310165 RepID=UPI003CEBCC1C